MQRYSHVHFCFRFFVVLLVVFPLTFLGISEVSAGTPLSGIALSAPTPIYQEPSNSSTVIKEYEKGSVLNYESYSADWYVASVFVDNKMVQGFIHKSDIATSVTPSENIHGVALKEDTPLYERANVNSDITKTYLEGTLLSFETFTSSWYKARVYTANGYQTTYLHHSDVEVVDLSSTQLNGVALNSPTKIYARATTDAFAVKYYEKGTILSYKNLNNNWYIATVYVEGRAKTGYIYKPHVESKTANQELKSAISLKSPTNVYSEASTSSNALKSYEIGSNLSFKTFTSEWYEATVYINGVEKTGYISKKDVEQKSPQKESFRGVGLKDPTPIYGEASRKSEVIKTYSQGSILNYETFSVNWYKATVYINGSYYTGFIHKDDVTNATKDQQNIKGFGSANPTYIYSDASIYSSRIKSYPAGQVLNFKTFIGGWYEAEVYIDGQMKTGYINANQIEQIYSENKVIQGLATKQPTNVYNYASRSSKIVKSYGKNTILKFESFSQNWYRATVYVDGKAQFGYIHRSDVSTEKLIYETTKYNYSFDYALDIQMTRTPKADGAGRIPATREQVAYYLNPSNFPKNSGSFYQFLVLSQPAGLDPSEVNSKILNNAGILSGKANAFIEAGQKYNINEAYLLSHVLHETGNGTSTLATGVPVDSNGDVVSESKATYTVYNMYGIGAVDDNPLNGGAKTAFKKGWFTPEKAIIGGAAFVSQNYIQTGQDTLYKMRWNPDNPGVHQYATHVAWAEIQTNKLTQIYNSLSDYILVFDIPSYQGQPEPGSEPKPGQDKPTQNITEFPVNVYGIVNADPSLNLREFPTTNSSILDSIPNNSKITVLGKDGAWYQVSYNGKTGWVHGDYLKLLNLLEIGVDNLNIRSGPSTSNEVIGQVSQGYLVAGVLDENNELVRDNEWYQIYYNGTKAWTSNGNGTYVYER